jgi:foldase protein PrsA
MRLGRRNRFHRTALLAAGLLAGVSGIGCRKKVQAPEKPPEKEALAARVNGRPIPLDRVTQGVEKQLMKLKKHGADTIAPELAKRTQLQRLDDIIKEELLLQASQELGVEDLEAKVSAQLAQMEASAGTDASGTPGHGKSPEAREKVRQKILVENYLQKNGLADPPVPEEEIRKLYESTKESFRRPAALHVAHILRKLPANAPQPEREAALSKMKALRAEIVAGRIPFDEAAEKNSECASAKDGGDLGEVAMGFMPKAFDEAAAKLQRDEVSGIVQTEHGLHIIKLLDKKPPVEPEYGLVKDFLAKYLRGNTGRRLLTAHLDQLKEKAKIEIYLQ